MGTKKAILIPRIDVPSGFGGRAAAERLVNAYVAFGSKFGDIETAITAIERDMKKKAFDSRTREKYLEAVILNLEDEGIPHQNNGIETIEEEAIPEDR